MRRVLTAMTIVLILVITRLIKTKEPAKNLNRRIVTMTQIAIRVVKMKPRMIMILIKRKSLNPILETVVAIVVEVE